MVEFKVEYFSEDTPEIRPFLSPNQNLLFALQLSYLWRFVCVCVCVCVCVWFHTYVNERCIDIVGARFGTKPQPHTTQLI